MFTGYLLDATLLMLYVGENSHRCSSLTQISCLSIRFADSSGDDPYLGTYARLYVFAIWTTKDYGILNNTPINTTCGFYRS